MARREKLNLPAGTQGAVWRVELLAGGRHMHRHEELEFNLVLEGRASYLVDDRRHDLRPGTLIWLYPEQDHLLIDHTPEFAMWIAVFRPELIEQVGVTAESAELRRDRPSLPISRTISGESSDELTGLMQRLNHRESQHDFYNAGLGYLLQLAWETHRHAQEVEQGTGVDPVVERVAKLLRDRPDAENVDSLAERVGTTPTRLSRLFLRQTGVSITTYRQRCALERFVQLFGDGSRLNATQAALEAGFGSYPQFHRVFKRHFGFGPAEYRRRVRDV